ncbi:30S ribosomal protein S1 [Phascolarctobacterium faecium]|uniref:30S ribosomal protein S1 n=1 Tax=Phascolarctobacterium faecium TaxID=33025 RepID=UPI003521D669
MKWRPKLFPVLRKTIFIRLSKIKAEQDAAWNYVADLAEGEKRRATVKVLRIIKNKMKNIVGLAVAVEGVEGFMPASHVELRRVEDFSDYIGKELEAEVIEVDTAKKRLVVSRRDLLRSEKEAKAQAWRDAKEARIQAAKEARTAAEEAAYASVEEGRQTVTGKVVRIADFGLFVEVGQGLVGLVHNTELSWDRNVKAEDAAKVDDEVTVLVKKIDRENRRVALSIKATQEDPWLTEAAAFKEGMVVEGTVERFLPFGAIVKLADKVEGLVHVSEIAETRVEKPEDILEIGQNVKVKVIKVDLKHKKIGLSIVKAVKEAEKAEYSSFINDKPELTLDLKEQLEGLNN